MKPILFLFSSVALLTFSACSDTHATDEHAHSSESPAACTYEEGRGLELTENALEFTGIEVVGFTGELPPAALLRTIKGDFVYVENDGWFLRTPADALHAGDRIVVSGVRTLWLAELQALNGGGHSH